MTYECIYQNFDNMTLDKFIKDKDYDTQISITILCDYIFDKSYKSLLSKFNYTSDDNTFQNLLYLNPYLRAIYLITTAHSYINKLSRVTNQSIIDDTNVLMFRTMNDHDETTYEQYDYTLTNFELTQFNQSLIKHSIRYNINNDNQNDQNQDNQNDNDNQNDDQNNDQNNIKSLLLSKIIYYIKYLLQFNGIIKITPINYKNVPISSETFDYEVLKRLAKIYVRDYEKYIPEISNNMFNEHHEYYNFINSIYELFYNLQIYQMYMTYKEEMMIKIFISQMIINKYNEIDNDNIIIQTDDLDEIADIIDDTLIKPKSFIISKYSMSLIEFDRLSENRIIIYNDTYDDYLVVKGNISENIYNHIDIIRIIQIEDILKEITNIYGSILNINPLSTTFKSYYSKCIDPFDAIYFPEIYSKYYKHLDNYIPQ